jgi:hypothetical protein
MIAAHDAFTGVIMDSYEIQIPIKYQGLDADRHEIEIIALGHSLQGAGKLIKAAGGAVLPQQRSARLRVFAKSAQPNCYEILAFLVVVQPVLPLLEPAAKRAIEAIVNYAIARFSKKSDDADRISEVAKTALEQMGMTSRAAMEATVRISENSKPAVRKFIAPVGDTCLTVMIGHTENGAILFNQDDREAIESDIPEIGDEDSFDIFITELDLQNQTCKFNLREESEDKRYSGLITDPTIVMPNNPYSLALSQKRWIKVRGKEEIKEGVMARLYISNST